jgi:hypothetical protein
MTRISLLYGSREERLQAQDAAVLAAFAAQGVICISHISDFIDIPLR